MDAGSGATGSGAEGVPLLDLRAQYATIRDEVDAAIREVCDTQRFILGPEVEALEREAAEYCGCRFAVGVSSGTDALIIALMAAGVGVGDEVVTTAYSFFATAGCISRLGAIPVFVDIEPQSFNIDPAGLEAVLTDRTRAVIPVHLFGQMARMAPILDLAKERGLAVIEDAAQAIGSELDGRRAGSLGLMGCFSFFPSKNLGAFGDGGLVTTDDEELAVKLRALRVHGGERKYYHRMVGGNFRLDAIQAAVLRVKLRYLDRWTAARQENAAAYNRLFIEADLAGGPDAEIVLPLEPTPDGQWGPRGGAPACSGHRHIYNQYVIRCRDRDDLKDHLTRDRIGCEIYYPLPLHLQECFSTLGYGEGRLPESERAARETLAIPVFPELGRNRQESVVESIRRHFRPRS